MKKVDVTLLRSDWRLIGYRAIHTAVVFDQNVHNENRILFFKISMFGKTTKKINQKAFKSFDYAKFSKIGSTLAYYYQDHFVIWEINPNN